MFALGEKPEAQRVKVRFATGLEQEWQQFINWQLADLLDDPSPPAWQVKLAQSAPTSPKVSVLFAARAAMVGAFIQAAEVNRAGALHQIELDDQHLAAAKEMARYLYRTSSGQEGFEKRIKNLKDTKEVFTTPHKLQIAKIAMEEAVERAQFRKLSRYQVSREVRGVTLGLLDELVKRGEIIELCGVEECKMGKTTRAYTLPKHAPAGDPLDALAEYEEAVADFAEHPEAFRDSEALAVAVRISERAAEIFEKHFLPVVSLSRLAKNERRMLPKLLEMFPDSLLLRGDACDIPEPKMLMDDEDTPLDRGGINLWVRYKPNGENFCDWRKSGKLKLAEYWSEDNAIPDVVPA